MCTPYCVVQLTTDDQARLDALHADAAVGTSILTYGLGVLVFLGAIAAIVTGLRR
jgi:hypothetical protein